MVEYEQLQILFQHIAVEAAFPRYHRREETAYVIKVNHSPYTFSKRFTLCVNVLLPIRVR